MEFMKLWMACLLLTSIGIAHAQIPVVVQFCTTEKGVNS